jgi:serine/threonine-protein kinase RsbW
MALSRWPTSTAKPFGWAAYAATRARPGPPGSSWARSDGEAALDHIDFLAVCGPSAGGLDPDGAVFVGVALREAVVNAFRHGRSPEGKPTLIGLHLTPDSLVITVRDRGPGFDPERVPDPCCDANLARGSGRGIYYMKRFTDRVSFVFPGRRLRRPPAKRPA